MMEDILGGLNEQQRAAVEATEGYVRLIAGAGSGKTRTLTHRFAYISQVLGISPANILCVTFTNKAAAEMRKRIKNMVGDGASGMITTFHGFCHKVLREDINKVGYPKSFLVIDTEDKKQLIRQVMEDMGLKLQDYKVKQIDEEIIGPKKGASLSYVGLMANTESGALDKYVADAKSEKDEIFYRYIREQKKSFALDFDDLIYFVLYIFNISRQTLEKWQSRLEYIMVDEFQDVDDSEYALVSKLAGKHHNLFIVGDPDQTIYSWRGSKVDYIMNFDKLNEGCTSLVLDKNYRSSPQIVAATNSLISRNKYRIEKQLVSMRPNGALAVYNHSRNDAEEAAWIADEIARHHESGVSYDHIAVLYRAHSISRGIEEALIKREIPYRVHGGVGFYERMEIKDALCYLRMITVGDDLAFCRVINTPRRGISRTKLGQLKEYAEQYGLTLYNALLRCIQEDSPILSRTRAVQFAQMIQQLREGYDRRSVIDLLEDILTQSGYEQMLRTDGDQERLDNLAELKQSIRQYQLDEGEQVTADDYLNTVTLMTSADQPDAVERVKLMTVHAAKGLEFPVVFVCELCEGVFPSRKTNTRDKMEEERRLAYVALTRAESVLYLSDSEGLTNDGSIKYPSRFIFDIEKNLLKYNTELSAELVETATKYIGKNESTLDKSRLEQGQKLMHPIFSEGEIISFNEKDNCYVVRFAPDRTRSISADASFLAQKSGE